MKSRLFFVSLFLHGLLSHAQDLPDVYPENVSQAHYYYENLGQLIDEAGNLLPNILYTTQHANPAMYLAQDKIHFAVPVIDTVDTSLIRLDMSFVCDYIQTSNGASESPCTPEVSTSGPTTNVINYYYKHCPDGVLNVNGYERIVYSEVYPDIDIELYSNEVGLKAYIVVKPYADPNNIVFLFDGQDSLDVDTTGWLEMYFAGNEIQFPEATAYQIDGGNVPYPLTWMPTWNDLGSGHVGFTTGAYNPNETLVIRLAGLQSSAATSNNNNINWSTYFGNKGREETKDVEYKAVSLTQDFFVLMDAWNPKGFMSSTGTHKTGYRAGHDVHLSKFNGSYEIQWETFYGGDDSDVPQHMEYSKTNSQIYVSGIYENIGANSLMPFPSTNNGSYIQPFASTMESFLVSFNDNGTVDWATYFGGEGHDQAFGLDIDDIEGVLYLAGTTTSSTTSASCSTPSSNKFPVCNSVSSGYFANANSGNRDGFVAAFDIGENSLIYSSFFGGSGDDYIYDIVSSGTSDGTVLLKNDDNPQDAYTPYFYLTGKSTTTARESTYPSPRSGLTNGSFPLSEPTGSYFQKMNTAVGSYPLNGFVAFYEGWNLMWNTFIGGDYEDEMHNVEIAGDKNVYVTGRTNSATTTNINCSYVAGHQIPKCTTNTAAHVETSSVNSEDTYVARFNKNHALIWATTMGHDDSHEQGIRHGSDIEIANHGTVFISTSTQNFSSNTSANNTVVAGYKAYNQSQNLPSPTATTGHNIDNYLMMFTKNNELKWATYFGGDGSDYVQGMETRGNRLLMGGYSESKSQGTTGVRPYPLEDPAGTTDYFQGIVKSTINGTITEFAIPQAFLMSVDNLSKTVEGNGIKSYPNPVVNELTVEVTVEEEKEVQLILIDTKGSVMRLNSAFLDKGLNSIKIDVELLDAGIYFLKITDSSSNYMESTKFIKKD